MIEKYFIVFFHDLEHLDKLKAIKENLLRRFAPLDPLLNPPPHQVEPKAQVCGIFSFWSLPLGYIKIQVQSDQSGCSSV